MAKKTLDEKKKLQAHLTALGVGFEPTESVEDLQTKADAHEAALNAEKPSGKKQKEVELVEGVDFIRSSSTGGKFVMVEVEEGKFRMFNPEGQKVSPILDGGSEEYRQEMQKMSRYNVIEDQKRRSEPGGKK